VNKLLLWISQGFGIGRIPFAPGTFGSLLGLGWFALLLLTGSFTLFALGTLAGLAASVWLCGVGERVLKERDPGSIVLDEITAIPLCFLGWIGVHLWQGGGWPGPEFFFTTPRLMGTLGVFAAFRFFDIAKPTPVRQSQSLPGGWGVTIDDALAAVYVNLVVLSIPGVRTWSGH
jgi:phosphatidylglycerophosphatase A